MSNETKFVDPLCTKVKAIPDKDKIAFAEKVLYFFYDIEELLIGEYGEDYLTFLDKKKDNLSMSQLSLYVDEYINHNPAFEDIDKNKECEDCINCEKCENCHSSQNCKICRNCKNCKNCENCRNCTFCKNCENCENCHSSQNCEECKKSNLCENCKNCRNCILCKNCTNCEKCYDCQNQTNKKNMCNNVQYDSPEEAKKAYKDHLDSLVFNSLK